ncbi:MAG: ketoacyl-ACP synthase III [Bdellovibrionales bacterium]|nr:ketoacyl-ACP synthase III [Bdellovibrionales bacterium]
MKSFIHSFARYLPPKVVTNNDLAKIMDTSDEWIQKRTGISERRFVEPPTTTSDLAVAASRKTLTQCGGIAPDAIIAATLSPDYDFPGIGVLVQQKLGLPHIPAFDIRNQCSGFLYAVELAAALTAQEKYSNILVVGAEVHSTGLDLTTRGRDIAVLFGDGAGSCLVSSKKPPESSGPIFEVVDSELHSDGEFAKLLWCQHVGSAHFPVRITKQLIEEALVFPSMDGRVVFEHAVKRMVEVSHSLLHKNHMTAEDIRLIIPHQANTRINSLVAKTLEIPEARVMNTIERYGNTTAATIPIGFSHAVEEVQLFPGDKILSCAFGSGFTWGAMVFQVVSH